MKQTEEKVEIFNRWMAEQNLLVTRLGGIVTKEHILNWKAGLQNALDTIPDNTEFKVLVNILGFKALDFEAHKIFRVILPVAMARHNLRIGYLDLFEDAQVQLVASRGTRCVAIAHVHHDEGKMNLYDTKCSRFNDRYFVDPLIAEEWITSFRV